ncbi:MAG TPA: tetratricopeptide repeat protein, partial [Chloroflexota bacterium]|nr:tetratricopeptide repeat protein [Chloroflexota bacterium]
MPALPTGTVTFLFTDIESSTRMMEGHPEAYRAALARHHAILRRAVEAHQGYVFETLGDGIFAAFEHSSGGVGAALDGQLALQAEPWGETGPLRVRMGLHTGEVELWGDHYFGPPLYRCGRLMALAHGGQVLLSEITTDLVRDALPEGAGLQALGEHQLRDLSRPEPIYQLLHADLPATFPPLRTLQRRPNNLPALTTPFIGRDGEIDTIRHQLLRRPDVRLITLLGPGGTGKTRLAIQAALDSLDDFPDGVFFVALARFHDPALVAPSIAQVLNVREAADRPLLDWVTGALQDKQILLILDNFEHVAGAAPFVGDLLTACPSLKILVTSRAVLGLYGEREFQVPPLSLPDPDRLPSKEQLAQFEAVRLFVERAQDITPEFRITDENARAVATICARLDGLPLAIELAAARTRLLSPQAMLSRLERRLPLLTGGARDLPARQQTLRNAIAWSYDLLEAPEQSLFRQLSVFAGSCTLSAAEAVCDPTGDAATGVLDGLESLAGKSLLRRLDPGNAGQDGLGGVPGPAAPGATGDAAGAAGPGGRAAAGAPPGRRPAAGTGTRETRFLMLQTIREYALEKLGAGGETARVQRRHAVHYAALAETAAPELRAASQAAWLERLSQERYNFRAALRWAIEHDEAALGLRLGGALWYFWHVHGYLSEGREWLATVLALRGAAGGAGAPGPPTPERARVLIGLGVLTADQGDFRAARALCEEGLAGARASGDEREEGSALAWLAHVVQDEPALARRLNEDALAIARRLDDRLLAARALNNLGELVRRDGDDAAAARYYEESLVLAREQGHQWRVAALTHNLGQIDLRAGDAPAAAQRFAESLGIFRSLGDQRVIAHCLAGLAAVAAVAGQPHRAARLWGAAETMLEGLGAHLDPADRVVGEQAAARARDDLGPALFDDFAAEGRAMSPAQVYD